uniref:uncharacterized protein LOC122609054 n=1 Tax=Erigeron canadensis TaxID=72917 RepID=UPI001CB904AB|nr:uncharacterized protein LOC122609054 [Erigeron canadensis]
MEKFVWEQIVTRFGITRVIVSDNGKQFWEGVFRSFCENLEIQQSFTSVAHPQANGQVEVTNRVIMNGIKARMGDAKTDGWTNCTNFFGASEQHLKQATEKHHSTWCMDQKQ